MIRRSYSIITGNSSASAEDSSPVATTQPGAKLSVSSKSYPRDWQKRVEKIVGGMREHNINLGEERTPDALQTRQAALVNLDRNIIELEIRLDQLRDDRNMQRLELWQLALSARQAVSGLYGSDSMQYQALGGTRASERKPIKRKPKA